MECGHGNLFCIKGICDSTMILLHSTGENFHHLHIQFLAQILLENIAPRVNPNSFHGQK